MTEPSGPTPEPGATPPRLDREAGNWGIQVEYVDDRGNPHRAGPDSVEATLRAMGWEGAAAPMGDRRGPLFGHPGQALPEGSRGTLDVEAGGSVTVDRALPPDLPLGYHVLHDDLGSRLVVVSPGRCHLPPGLRAWGWAVQLYAARSAASWGMGDLGDLRDLGAWAASQGAGFQLVNPLHAVLPGPPQQDSPYFPSSRVYRNPLYLRVEDLPGARGHRAVTWAALRGRALNQLDLLDRDRVEAAKSSALEALFSDFTGDAGFDAYCARQGQSLTDYATFCVLVERQGRSWRQWPEGLRRPGSATVREFASSHRRQVVYHQWLQWHVARQLAVAGGALPVVNDLAVGVDPGGADAWTWQDLYAPGMHVGAPPDEFNTGGQDWGLPPFDPHRLRAADYRPWIETVRAAFEGGGGLRVDHVMGLFRLWWVDAGRKASDGVYVRYPASELLDILALESHRAGAFVVGEDLGTVEPGVREELARRRLLSYRLLMFEEGDPADFPSEAMAAVNTHDLPTIAGLCSGADLHSQQEIGLEPNIDAVGRVTERVRSLAGAGPGSDPAAVVDGAYAALGRAPSALLCASLDDACVNPRRPNMPGTIDAWPNWRIPLPVPLEQLRDLPLARQISKSLNRE